MERSSSCGHHTCRCTKPYDKTNQATGTRYVDPDSEFCADRCAQQAAGSPGDGGCQCGHVQCSAPSDVGIPEMQ